MIDNSQYIPAEFFFHQILSQPSLANTYSAQLLQPSSEALGIFTAWGPKRTGELFIQIAGVAQNIASKMFENYFTLDTASAYQTIYHIRIILDPDSILYKFFTRIEKAQNSERGYERANILIDMADNDPTNFIDWCWNAVENRPFSSEL